MLDPYPVLVSDWPGDCPLRPPHSAHGWTCRRSSRCQCPCHCRGCAPPEDPGKIKKKHVNLVILYK